MTRIVLLAVLAAAAIAPTAATAQSNGPRINIELTWEGQPPARISVQTPRGPTDYSVGNQVLRIDQAGSQGVDRNYLIVRYPGVNHQFGVRARTGEPFFPVRLRSPVGMMCNTRSVVSPIVRDARSNDTFLLVNAALAAGYLLETNECREADKSRLRGAQMEAHCGLARETNLFRLPDGAGTPAAVVQCRYQIAASMARAGRIEQMDETLTDMRAALATAEGPRALALAGLTENHLRRVEVDGLYNTALAFREASDMRGQILVSRLAVLSRQPDYTATFRDAFRPGIQSRSSPAVIVRSLERQFGMIREADRSYRPDR